VRNKKFEYVTVQIPKVLRDHFEKIREKYGYRSFAEFVIEAVRDKLEKMG